MSRDLCIIIVSAILCAHYPIDLIALNGVALLANETLPSPLLIMKVNSRCGSEEVVLPDPRQIFFFLGVHHGLELCSVLSSFYL